MKTILSSLIIYFTVLLSTAFSNNIQVANISITNNNEVSNWAHIEFDVSWQNSWRVSSGPANWDAAWIFIKYRVNGGTWTHGIISQANSESPAGSTLDVTPDGIGAVIYRDADGNGNVNWQDVRLRWNYGSTDNMDIVDIQVFAIEMVYVPEGSFYVGGTAGDMANKFHSGGFSTSSSFRITSEDALTIANTSGNLYYTNDNAGGGDHAGVLSANYPKGFNDFYCMKYEVSQEQWIDYYNSLNDVQKTGRDITDATHKSSDAVVARNGISWTSGNATTSLPNVALNYASVADINSYMDWTGLRPMSELEYEKACRGPILPKVDEYAWGTSAIHAADYTLVNSGSSSENISNVGNNIGNALYSLTNGIIAGPVRCGIFASSSPNHSRAETGGSYYGIMGLTGNLYERCVTVGTAQGRNFSGLHGNGIISSSTGNGTVSNWPNNTTGDGYSFRGGSWTNGSDFIRVSDRFDGASLIFIGNNRIGFRAVRTAP